jgi:hypothetical protein
VVESPEERHIANSICSQWIVATGSNFYHSARKLSPFQIHNKTLKTKAYEAIILSLYFVAVNVVSYFEITNAEENFQT